MSHTSPHFAYFDFDPSDDLKKKAELTTKRLLDLAPYGSIIVAVLRKSDELYQCSIELYSGSGPFKAFVAHEEPERALGHVARTLSKKLERWKELQSLSSQFRRFRPLTQYSA